jgi:prepilin peptidase CpaA
MIHALFGYALLLVVLLAMAVDVATFRIPNAFPAVILMIFACAAIVAPHPVDWLSHLGAGLLVLAVGTVCFEFRFLGGGDVKLLASVALWFGWPLLPDFVLVVGLIGGVFGGALLIARQMAPVTEPYWYRLGLDLPRLLRKGEAIPYGLAIGAAVPVVMAISDTVGGP